MKGRTTGARFSKMFNTVSDLSDPIIDSNKHFYNLSSFRASMLLIFDIFRPFFSSDLVV